MAKKKYSNSTVSTAKGLVPMDDALFQEMCEDKELCEEMISTILDEKVKVIEVVPQRSIGNIKGRAVRLDCLCLLENGTYVNVEVQKTDNDDHEARVRYNAALVATRNTPKGVKFAMAKKVIVIFITRFDIFGEDLPIYHVDRVVRETGKVRDNGFTEIYVNATVKNYVGTLNTNVSNLMDLFVDRTTMNPEKFPNFSRVKNWYVNTKEGMTKMCDKLESLMQEERKITAKKIFFKAVQDGAIQVAYAARELDMTVEEFLTEMVSEEYKLPKWLSQGNTAKDEETFQSEEENPTCEED